jgi:predicted permease
MNDHPQHGWRGLHRVFRLPRSSGRMRDDVDAELTFHLDGRIEELMDREHLSRADAEAEARRRFGDIREYRRQTQSIDQHMHRRRSRMELLDSIRRESRQAIRALGRAPSFTFITFVTLALGIGASTAIFTMLDRVVLSPLPYPNADRLVHIGTLWPGVKADAEFGLSRGQYFYFKQNSGALEDLAFYDRDVLAIPGDGGDHPAERVPIVYASLSTFKVLGIRPALGRLFGPDEMRLQDRSVVLLSHEYWLRRYGGDSRIVGQRMSFGGTKTVEIIGVLQPGAVVPEFKADLWVANHLDPSDPPQNNHTHNAIGLLKPGVTPAGAEADLKRLQSRFAELYPAVYPARFIQRTGFAIHVNSLRDHVVGPRVSRALWIIFASVGLVLLIAAANVANLFLVRMEVRRREVALRTALGAGRAHLALQYLTESLILTLVSAVCALGLAYGLLHLALAFAPSSLPRLDEVSLGGRSIAFCLTVSILTGVVFGLLPTAGMTRSISMLRDGSRGLTASRGRNTARRALVVCQVALAIVLLTGAGLMVKSFLRLRDVKSGIDPTGVESMVVSLPYARYDQYATVATFWHELSRRVEALPGVRRSAITTSLPLTGDDGCSAVVTDGALHTTERGACVSTILVSPGYFETMGIRVNGTTPTWGETESQAAGAVVSRAFANRFWPGENPIGHGVRVSIDGVPFFRVVGVTDDVRANGLQNPPITAVYFPIVPNQGGKLWQPPNYAVFVVRTLDPNPSNVARSVRQILGQMDSQVPLANAQSMELVVAKSMAQTSFTMLLLAVSAGVALLLSAVGIYGVISYIVSQRRSEIGIRMALGARTVQVGRMVVLQSVALAAFGAIVGLTAAFLGTRTLRALLFEVSPTDPMILVVVPVVLLAIAAAASLAPAWRAANVDPATSLRAE